MRPRLSTTNRLRRAARCAVWAHPRLYYPIGIMRRQGSVLRRDFDIYIEGFPRSANTFAKRAFLLANPTADVRAHRHIPSFVIRSAQRDEPGMVLVRDPVDATTSWSLFAGVPIEHALAYYVDYYSVLLPFRQDLLVVTFDEVSVDFGSAIARLNDRWRTSFLPFDHTPGNVRRCMAAIDDDGRDRDGRVGEMQVSRPSGHRAAAKDELIGRISGSGALRASVARAQDVFRRFAA